MGLAEFLFSAGELGAVTWLGTQGLSHITGIKGRWIAPVVGPFAGVIASGAGLLTTPTPGAWGLAAGGVFGLIGTAVAIGGHEIGSGIIKAARSPGATPGR